MRVGGLVQVFHETLVIGVEFRRVVQDGVRVVLDFILLDVHVYVRHLIQHARVSGFEFYRTDVVGRPAVNGFTFLFGLFERNQVLFVVEDFIPDFDVSIGHDLKYRFLHRNAVGEDEMVQQEWVGEFCLVPVHFPRADFQVRENQLLFHDVVIEYAVVAVFLLVGLDLDFLFAAAAGYGCVGFITAHFDQV